MPRSRCQLRVRDPQIFLLLPLLARPHRHAPILQTKPVDTSTLSAHESELAPRAVKLSELRDLACEEALLNGDYERVLRQVDREIVDKPDDVHLWYFGAVAELELHGSPPP